MENTDKNNLNKRTPLDVRLINPFISGTKEVFEVMAGVPVKRRSVSMKQDYKMFGEISGVMGLAGNAAGSVVISFPKQLADKVVSKFLGIEDGEDISEDDVRDGIGEILNMIVGKAKTLLANTEYYFKLSIPTVIIGKNYEISHPKDTPCIVVLFESMGLQFVLQVSLTPQKKQ